MLLTTILSDSELFETDSPLFARPVFDNSLLREGVAAILSDVKAEGDEAVKRYALRFDGACPDPFEVPMAEILSAGDYLPEPLKSAIDTAAANIETFHRSQLSGTGVVETMEGVHCWRKDVAIGKVGLYVPGGTAPLFSTILMLGIPARLAGCSERILCTPPDKEGRLHPAILYCAKIAGIGKVFRIGGPQAIAAMAYGTATVPKVFKIFGPGNQYVTCAKQIVQAQGTAIDMPAGPSEVCVLADATADPVHVAADLLAQAEHGPDSHVLLVTTDLGLAMKVTDELHRQLRDLPRQSFAERSLEKSRILVAKDMDMALRAVNTYSPEHLIVNCADAGAVAEQITDAGSVFIGSHAPESVGDYASGTNHTLPTNGHARAYSGVSMDSFVKKITFQHLTPAGLRNIGPIVMEMARAEGLEGHANAVAVRLNDR